MPPIVRSATREDKAELAGNPFCNDCFLVAVEDGRVRAYLAWRRISPDECEVLQLETEPAFRRRGLARLLVRELKKQEHGDLFLEVRESNLPARKLYESEGFIPIGLRRNYYSAPAEDGIVLRFHPC